MKSPDLLIVEANVDESVNKTVAMTDEEYAEEHARQALHFATLPTGMKMIRHASKHGRIRLRAVAEAEGLTIGNARTYMWRMQRIGLFEKDYPTQRDVTYILTSDGLAVAKCLEILYHSREGGR